MAQTDYTCKDCFFFDNGVCGSVKKNASGETFREMMMLAQISSIRK